MNTTIAQIVGMPSTPTPDTITPITTMKKTPKQLPSQSIHSLLPINAQQAPSVLEATLLLQYFGHDILKRSTSQRRIRSIGTSICHMSI